MKLLSKLVAMGLAAALLAAPGAALANCRATSEEAARHGCCSTAMEAHAATASVNEAPSEPACCDVSAGQPAPVSQLQAPDNAAAAMNPPQVQVAIAIASACRHLPEAASAKVLPSSQAVLCTFLI